MHNFFLPASNLDLVLVDGPDAIKFLQGQVTCDVAAVPDPGFTRGALCNNKGRVLATFTLVRQGSAFFLVMPKGLGKVLTTVLNKYLPFYKCTFRQALSAENPCFGLSGTQAAATLGTLALALPEGKQCTHLADGWICNLDPAQQQFLVCSGTLQTDLLRVQGNLAVGTFNDWLLTGIESGQFPFLPEDVEKYTPQELNLDRHDYVSFTKGCYTGQEIVARMHYRGKHKRHLFLLKGPASAGLAQNGQMEVFDANGQLLGSTLKILQGPSDTLVALASLPAEMEQSLPTNVKNAAGSAYDLRPF